MCEVVVVLIKPIVFLTFSLSSASLDLKVPIVVKRQQARFFKKKIEHLTEEEAVVQVDFAENFSCKYQGEVQSAHWSQDQVTLFTVAIWTKSGDKNSCCESHVIVSDDLKHDKTSVAVFMCKVVNDLVKGRHPNIT